MKKLEELEENQQIGIFIEKQPELIKTALKLLVETGDLWYSAKIAGVGLDELNEMRLKAKIPLVVI